ncbi:uncharacterized protein LOC130719690 [Lotus japonicus]|uniref:uncharacterized protein LOC130719690 n=1 Tax=Lotus japonicus TaxID=34305 RepID=UPI002586D829|nr:uncharacterized protein LOC130719690 [Lotus japonicus]
MGIDLTCPLYAMEPETAVHSLLLCSFAQAVWFTCPLGLQVATCPVGSVSQFLAEVVFEADEVVILCAAAVMEALWECRNKVVFKDGVATVQGVVRRVARLMEVIVEEPVASSSAAATTSCLEHALSPAVAEAQAFRWAVILAQELFFQDVHLETDCYSFYEAWLKGGDETYMGMLIRDCLLLSGNFRSFHVSFIRRTGNMAADFMAKLAYSDPERVWVEDVAEGLSDILYSNLHC